MAEHFRHSGHILRFIEYMDVGTTNGCASTTSSPPRRSAARSTPIGHSNRWATNYPGEVANRYRYRDDAGEVGLIASVTQPFCGSCTRARLSADGKLHTCLFANRGHNLRDLLRRGATDQDLEHHLHSIWTTRADRYSDARTAETAQAPKVEMSYIGG